MKSLNLWVFILCFFRLEMVNPKLAVLPIKRKLHRVSSRARDLFRRHDA